MLTVRDGSKVFQVVEEHAHSNGCRRQGVCREEQVVGVNGKVGRWGVTRSETDQTSQGLRKHDRQADVFAFELIGTRESLRASELESDGIETR